MALRSGRSCLTYRELDARAGRLAGRLRSLGVGRDVPVGVRLERSFDQVIALLAVMKAGGAFCRSTPPGRTSASASCWTTRRRPS